jgi:hypothetical protein
LHELGAQSADRLHHALDLGAHLCLELAVLAAAIVEFALGFGEPCLVRRQRDAVLGALGDRGLDGAAL